MKKKQLNNGVLIQASSIIIVQLLQPGDAREVSDTGVAKVLLVKLNNSMLQIDGNQAI